MKGNNIQHNKKHNHTRDEGRNSLNTNLDILHNKPMIVNMTEVDNSMSNNNNKNESSKNIISKPYYLRGNSANSRYNKHNKQITNKQNEYPFTNSNNNNNNYGNGGNNNNNIKVNLIKPQYDGSSHNNYSSSQTISPFNKTYTQSYLPTIRMEDDIVSKKLKNKKLSIEHGVTYKIGNGFKYYYHIPSMELYLLQEIKFNDIGNLIQKIDDWNSQNINNILYLHITQTLINVPEGYITIVIEQPLGERLIDIIESTGFMNENFIYTITKQLLDNYNSDSNSNVCICDLYFDIYEKVKVIPPFVIEQIKPKKQCTCNFMLDILSKNLNFNVNKHMHIGLIILKLMIGNINLDIFNYMLVKSQNTSTSKTFMKMKKCCLMHLLFDIEQMHLQSTSQLTLKNIITNVYSDSFMKLLCCLLSFESHKQVNYISKYISILSHMSYNRVHISMNELLKVVKLQHQTQINDFINRLFFVLSSLSGNISHSSDSTALSKEFLKRLNEKKHVLFFLSYMFDVDKDEFVEKIEMKLVKKSITGSNKNINGINEEDSGGKKKKKYDKGVNGQEVC